MKYFLILCCLPLHICFSTFRNGPKIPPNRERRDFLMKSRAGTCAYAQTCAYAHLLIFFPVCMHKSCAWAHLLISIMCVHTEVLRRHTC
ncbi:uncharacterized protein DS421_18g621240 [Arachis hypogaea]|nr:uncharacterized protein DS421_18g621240 [Arachis hypogaea]